MPDLEPVPVSLLPALPPAVHRAPSPLLVRLRAETRSAHDRIEALPALSCLLSPTLLLPDYLEALHGLLAFHACLHAVLPPLLRDPVCGGSASPDVQPDGSLDSGALHALAEDLAFFGAPSRRRMRKPAVLTDAAAALGGFYVVEGSALGARVIGRAVGVSLGVSPGAGGSFFCGASADTARQRWQAFCRRLETAEPGLDEAASRRVVAGALGCFQALEDAMGTAKGDNPGTEPRPFAGKTRRLADAVRPLN